MEVLTTLEGRRITPSNLEESKLFAKKRDLPQLQYILLPRVKGFEQTVQALRPQLDAIYDLTIHYSELPGNLWTFFSGKFNISNLFPH